MCSDNVFAHVCLSVPTNKHIKMPSLGECQAFNFIYKSTVCLSEFIPLKSQGYKPSEKNRRSEAPSLVTATRGSGRLQTAFLEATVRPCACCIPPDLNVISITRFTVHHPLSSAVIRLRKIAAR